MWKWKDKSEKGTIQLTLLSEERLVKVKNEEWRVNNSIDTIKWRTSCESEKIKVKREQSKCTFKWRASCESEERRVKSE